MGNRILGGKPCRFWAEISFLKTALVTFRLFGIIQTKDQIFRMNRKYLLAGLGIACVLTAFLFLTPNSILEQDNYQKALQEQLILQSKTLEKQATTKHTDAIRQNIRKKGQYDALVELGNRLNASYKQNLPFLQTNPLADAAKISALEAQKMAFNDHLKRTFSVRIAGVDPKACTPERIDEYINSFQHLADSLSLETQKVDWKTAYFSSDYSPAQIASNLALARNNQLQALLHYSDFAFGKMYGLEIGSYLYQIMMLKPQLKAQKDKDFNCRILTYNGQELPAVVKKIWVNNQEIQPEYNRIRIHEKKPNQAHLFSYALKAIVLHPITGEELTFTDTLYCPFSKPTNY
jgi:hypothetical protein